MHRKKIKTKKEKIYILESDFNININNLVLIKPPYKFVNKFYKRVLTLIYYFLKLLFIKRRSIIIAPWGLFWIPAILNKLKIKKFKIISITCDTFLSQKTIAEKNKGILQKIKYLLAKSTYKEVHYFIYCSEVVREQLIKFGVPKNKIIFKYQEWIRYTDRYKEYQKITPNIFSNTFLFIGHYYNIMQKRLDLLINAFIKLKKSDKKLIVIGRDWDKYFGKNKIKEYEKKNIKFVGECYDIKKYIEESAFYIHPGEYEGFGTAVIEAMIAGLIPVVSDKTGSKEAVIQVDKKLVVELNEESFQNIMNELINLSLIERKKLSVKSRAVAKSYSLSNSSKNLSNNIKKLILEE